MRIRLQALKEVSENNKHIDFYVKTSTIVKGEFNKVSDTIEKATPFIKGIVTSNVGIISKFKDECIS